MRQSLRRTAYIGVILAGVSAVLVAPAAVAGQSIRVQGEVIDALTRLPISGVVIQFPELGLITMSDSMGYFVLDDVPAGEQVINAYHVSYLSLTDSAPLEEGEVLVINLTPQAFELEGVEVSVISTVDEARASGTPYDVIDSKTIASLRTRQSRVLEVIRQKASPRLRIQEQAGGSGTVFCISSTRRTASVQEIRDLGQGCHPTMIVVDNVVLFAPTVGAVSMGGVPSEVASMILTLNPEEIESVRLLGRTEAFFRYGEDGRLGALMITTRKPGR
jgi:CarboxypepD_reg-like domain